MDAEHIGCCFAMTLAEPTVLQKTNRNRCVKSPKMVLQSMTIGFRNILVFFRVPKLGLKLRIYGLPVVPITY